MMHRTENQAFFRDPVTQRTSSAIVQPLRLPYLIKWKIRWAVNGTSSSVQIQLLFSPAVSKSKQRGLEDILGWFLCVRFFKCFRIGFQKGSDGRSILVCHLGQRWFNFIFQLPPESGIVIKPISSKFQASFQQIHACIAECLSPLTASHWRSRAS